MIPSPVTARQSSQRQTAGSFVSSREDDATLACQGSEPNHQDATSANDNLGGASVTVVSRCQEGAMGATDSKPGSLSEMTLGKVKVRPTSRNQMEICTGISVLAHGLPAMQAVTLTSAKVDLAKSVASL